MSRELFHQELRELQDEVLELGSMAEKAIMDALESLRDGDALWSQKIVEDDRRINHKRFEIEDRCLFVIASQQPMATDLRALVSILYIIIELERIGDPDRRAVCELRALTLARDLMVNGERYPGIADVTLGARLMRERLLADF